MLLLLLLLLQAAGPMVQLGQQRGPSSVGCRLQPFLLILLRIQT